MQIPFFSLDRQHKKIKNQISNAIEQVLETKQFIGGSFVQEFEENFSKYVKAEHTISCNSGTDALWLALKALNVKKNSIVLTTPFSFIASSSEIVSLGAHPVFIDIDPDTYNVDPEKIILWINDNCKTINGQLIHTQTQYPVCGILTVDIFGQCADYKKIKKIAEDNNLWIIEDACQAVGSATQDEQPSGTLGDISCFSFYPTKNLGAYGDAGCCTTNNPELAQKLIRLRNHGRKSHYNYTEHGINSRLDGIQAAILNTKLKELSDYNNSRINIAKIYDEELSNLNLIKLPQNKNGKHTYHQYCMQVLSPLERNLFAQQLKEKGIGTNIYYPKNLNKIDFLNTDKRLENKTPISENLTETVLALPIWPELTQQEVEYICDTVKQVVKLSLALTGKANAACRL